MEFVEGVAVSPPDSPLKLLEIAVQMAEGLAAAHAAGIVHRDLKPDNILITREGRVKILDFGLAKAAHQELSAGDATRTIALHLTDPGTTVGTIAYLSPEQARGEVNLTAQSDQFSLGLMLYELAAGKRAFQRGSAAEIMTAIIREDAEPLPASVPPPFRWIVERLLHKEPSERYVSTLDLFRELRQLRDRLSESVSASMSASAIPASETAPAATRKRRMRVWVALAAALVLVAGLAATLLRPSLHPSGVDLSAYKFTAITRDEAPTKRYPVWSPDGKSIAYTASIHGIDQVFTKILGAPDAAELTHASFPCTSPFWSPDSANIYYTSHGDLWSVGASGGKPVTAMERTTVAAIHPEGKAIVFERDGKIHVAPLKRGAPALVPKTQDAASAPYFAGKRSISSMNFSPNGSQLAAILNRNTLWVQAWPSGAPRDLGVAGTASWLPDNRHVVVSAPVGKVSTLTVVDTPDGSRRVIHKGTDAIATPTVSPDGRKIAYMAGATNWEVLEASLTEGRVRTVAGGVGVSFYPDWAPSGTHFLFSRGGLGVAYAIEDRSTTAGFSRRVAEASGIVRPSS